MSNMKYALALIFACFLMSTFAQEELENPAEPKKIAVYVFGASEAGVNKSFGNKLLATITQSDKYAEIGDSEAFYEAFAGQKASAAQISQAAKQYGADVVCVVSMTEAFGAYSIFARLIKTADSQVIRIATLDRSLNSFADLTVASNELVGQLLGLAPQPMSQSPLVPAAAPAAEKECENKLNINEIISKIKSGFLPRLKDCSGTLAKNMALAMSPFGKKGAVPEPVSFMKECTIDGIKQKLPDGAEEYVRPIEKFLQNIMNAASAAGGSLDVKKLPGIISGLNVNDLINELKTKATNDECVVDEPYEPDEEYEEDDDEGDSGGKKDRKIVSLGLRAGFNFSHMYAYGYRGSNSIYGNSTSVEGSYNSILGFQAGLLIDIAPSSWFHFQPGVMYIQKGAEDNYGFTQTLHYIEFPLLLSFKISALRLNAGPYFGVSVGHLKYIVDKGISTGFGFDISVFYIGMFYDHGFTDFSRINGFEFYNRTLGFNFGVNI